MLWEDMWRNVTPHNPLIGRGPSLGGKVCITIIPQENSYN